MLGVMGSDNFHEKDVESMELPQIPSIAPTSSCAVPGHQPELLGKSTFRQVDASTWPKIDFPSNSDVVPRKGTWTYAAIDGVCGYSMVSRSEDKDRPRKTLMIIFCPCQSEASEETNEQREV